MFLSEIKIGNFRIFQDFKIILNPGMNIIIGENNSGKTALIDAIKYALGTNSGEWIGVSENDFHKTENHFHIQLKFEEISPKQASVFVEHLTHELVDEDQRRSVLFVNYEATMTDQIRRGYRYIKTIIKSGQNSDGPRIEREIRDYLSATYLKPLRDSETEMTAGRGSRLSQILSVADELTQGSNDYNDLIEILTAANQKLVNNPGIKTSRKKITERLRDLTFTDDQFNPVIDILDGKDPSEMSELEKWRLFKSILEKFNLLLDGENPLQGLGYNNVLFIATELLLLQKEKDDFTLLLIEEPEAHLHPQLQMKLLKFIRDRNTLEDYPKLQSILTTHSPNLASKAPLTNLILMSVDGKGFSLRKGETELDKGDYEFLEKFLDVTKSNLFFAKAVLIVEGDCENILLPTIAELLDRPLENYGVSIVNIGNTAFTRYANIFKRKDHNECENDTWIPIKVGCLRDLDLWPDKAEDKPDNEPFGFKRKKGPNSNGHGGNLYYWKNEYSDHELTEYIKEKKNIEGQNVKVFLSDDWTFEYSLAKCGLAAELYKAVHGSDEGFVDLSNDTEEKAIAIYKTIDEKKLKTEVAYKLVNILHENSREDHLYSLKDILPPYIVDAISYVTEPITFNKVSEDQQEVIIDE